MTEQTPPYGGTVHLPAVEMDVAPIRGGYGARAILPCECLCEHCTSERIFLATLLSEVRQALGMWKSGFTFSGPEAELLAEVTATLKGGR